MSAAIEIKPATFANGVPKEQHNGFFGDGKSEQILQLPIGTQVTAIVTYQVADDITKRGKGVRYPVLAIDHIEPIWDSAQGAEARELQEAAYTERTGADQLDFSIEDGAE